MNKEEIFATARKAVIEANTNLVEETARRGLEEGIDPMHLMNQGFIQGINKVGDLFGVGKLFLPELIQSAEVMQKATDIINAALPGDQEKGMGKMVVGTVEGGHPRYWEDNCGVPVQGQWV